MNSARKNSIGKKLAAALSIVNALNAAAPVALPYVTVTKSADGVAPGALVNVAEANGGDKNIESLSDGDHDVVDYGETHSVGTVKGGSQLVNQGGVGKIGTMEYGEQTVNSFAYSGSIETMKGGSQIIRQYGYVGTMSGGTQAVTDYGGRANIGTMSGGAQVLLYEPQSEDDTYTRSGHIGTMDDGDGTQIIGSQNSLNHCSGSIDTMNGGTQILWTDPNDPDHYEGSNAGYIKTMNGGTQIVQTNQILSVGASNVETIGVMNGGVQIVSKTSAAIGTMNGGTQILQGDNDMMGDGVIRKMNGGTQIVSANAYGHNGNVSSGAVVIAKTGGILGNNTLLSGGTMIVKSGGEAQQTTVSAGGVLEEWGGARVEANVPEEPPSIYIPNNYFLEGAIHRLKEGTTKNGYIVDNHVLEVENGAITSKSEIKNGGKEIISSGGTSKDAVIADGGTQIISADGVGSASSIQGGTLVMAGGTLSGQLRGYGTISGGAGLAGATVIASGGKMNADALTAETVKVSDGSALQATGNISATSATLDGVAGANPFISAGGSFTATHLDITNLDRGAATDTIIVSAGNIPNTTLHYTTNQETKTNTLEANHDVVIDRDASIVRDEAKHLGFLVISKDTISNTGTAIRCQSMERGQIWGARFREGKIAWENGGTYYTAPTGTATSDNYVFQDNAKLYLNQLDFSFTEDAVKSLTPGTGMTLIQNVGSDASIQADAPAIFTGLAYNGGINTNLLATATGQASVEDSNLKYTMSKVALNAVTLKDVVPGTADTVPAGWVAADGGVKVGETDIFRVRLRDAGTATTVLRSADNTHLFSDVEIDERIRFGTERSFVTQEQGVVIDVNWHGGIRSANEGTALEYAVDNLKVTKLTFGDVEWLEQSALLNHENDQVDFNGAKVNTTNINFTNIAALGASKQMTLVKNFGNTVGEITGDTYKVGSTIEGKGHAYLNPETNDLNFITDTSAVQEQTHNTLMGAGAAMETIVAGNDFIGEATQALSLPANVGSDGISSFAQMGGASMRQETGSHIDVHTWNAILALGHQNKKERGTFEYGAFFEYGTGNYTTVNGDERGDGSISYTGGGALAKWTAKHGLYVEGSLRAGTAHGDARNLLRDGAGAPYSYETHAPYWGAHLGVGKEIAFDDMHSLDVYGKYFYNRRNGVSFNAGGHYDLDALTSQVVRIGARYTIKKNKWDFYGGLAYEHELDGKATGTADGFAIRGTDPSGASLRAEIGATMQPDANSPWKLDLNLAGFAGKKQGFSGGVSVAFMF